MTEMNERTTRDVDLDPALARHIDELPRSVEPARDLWPEIEARLDARQGADVLPFRRRVVRAAAAVVPTSLPRALAALLWMGLGGALMWWATGGGATPPRSGSPLGAPSPTVSASYASSGAAVSPAEIHYLRAKEELWLMAYRERENLSPEGWEMVRRNLEILDGAIDELRHALSQDPGNTDLEARLLDSHRRGLTLLRHLTDEV